MDATLITIFMAISIGLIIVAFIMMVDWRSVASKWVASNPSKARIYVRIGDQTDPVNGSLIIPCLKGSVYAYRWNKIRLAVYVPSSYKYLYLRTTGRRIINVEAGNGIAVARVNEMLCDDGLIKTERDMQNNHKASPLDWPFDPNERITVSAGDLNAVVASGIGTALVKSLFGKSVNVFMTIIIMAVVAVVGFILIKNIAFPDERPPQSSGIESQLEKEGVIIESK